MKQARTAQVCKPRAVQYIINLHAQEVLTLADQAGEIIANRLVKGLSVSQFGEGEAHLSDRKNKPL